MKQAYCMNRYMRLARRVDALEGAAANYRDRMSDARKKLAFCREQASPAAKIAVFADRTRTREQQEAQWQFRESELSRVQALVDDLARAAAENVALLKPDRNLLAKIDDLIRDSRLIADQRAQESAPKYCDFAGKLAKVRAEIDALRAEVSSIERAPLPKDEALARLTDGIARRAAAFNHRTRILTDPSPGIADPANALLSAVALNHEGQLAPNANFAFWVFGDAIAKRYRAELDELYKTIEPGLPSRARRPRIAEIGTKIIRLEIEEEDIIHDADMMGLRLARRVDADPAIVLGLGIPASELEPPEPPARKSAMHAEYREPGTVVQADIGASMLQHLMSDEETA